MSDRVSIVKTDFGWSEEWLQEVIIVQKASLYIFSEKLIFETQRSQEPNRYFHSWFPLLKDAFC